MPSVPTPAAARYIAAGTAHAAGADQQHLALQQLDLACLAYFPEQRVAAVAQALFRSAQSES